MKDCVKIIIIAVQKCLLNSEKLLKTPFVIYVYLECLLLKQQSCQNNPNKSDTERKAIHEPMWLFIRFSLFI